LAKDIDTEDSFGNALLLNVTGMLKAAINYGALEFGLQKHVFETRGVHTNEGCGFAGAVHLLLCGALVVLIVTIHQFDILVIVR